MPSFISIAICTWNRAKLLDRTLTRLAEVAKTTRSGFELIVVDNGSTDETPLLADRHCSALPLVYARESRLGHTFARNRAIEIARGDLLLWTDDDVLVGDHWIDEYAQAARSRPEATFFGGPVNPDFETPPPPWLIEIWESISALYAIRQLGDEPFALEPARVPFGANFAIRTEVQRRHRFDERIGRRGRALGAADETTLLRRLLAEGHTGWWTPSAYVKHFIPKERLTPQYLRGNFYNQGKVAGIHAKDGGESLSLKETLRLFLRACLAETRSRFRRPERETREWLRAASTASWAWGRLAGSVVSTT